jgi:hypothetical protein
MATRLYFHAATSGLSNLPTTEQSTLTATYNIDAQTVNKTMHPIKGTAVVNLTKNLTATGSQNAYFTKFVSPTINTAVTGTTISANTWDYVFSAMENQLTMNFPCTGATQTTYVNCYVWETSNGTKLGTILDGNSTANYDEPTSAGTQTWIKGTFTGSAVNSVTSTCVIIMEIWFVFNPTVTSDTLFFYYDGKVETTADNGTNTDAASYISTPQDITYNETPALFFRVTANGLAGTLPSAEQSALTSILNVDAQTVNRSLNTTKGASQTSLTLTSNATASLQDYYFTKFVSWQYLNQTSIGAGNWGYAFAANESNAAANFPCAGATQAVYVNCYVWKTSNGTKTGTILDGNTALTFAEPTAISTITSEQGTFVGSAVSGITPGDDVLVLEVWFRITQGGAASRTDIFYYDGATITPGNGITVSDECSFIMAPVSLAFTATQAAGIKQTIMVEWEEE